MTSTNRMSGYAYSQYNDAYETASERNSHIFWDALSMASGSDRNSIALSIYHSVPELHEDESSRYHVPHGSRSRAVDKNWHDYQDEDDGIEKLPDFILSYNQNNDGVNKIKRQIYERKLTEEGLVLKRDESQKIHFVKIYATREVLCRYSEILKFKYPIRLDVDESEDQEEHDRHLIAEKSKSVFQKFYQLFRLNRKLFPEKRYELFHEYSRDKGYLFDIHDPQFFPSLVRISIVNFILERTAFADQPDDNCIGIDKLLSDGAYDAAYPLHDGHHSDADCQRGLLYKEWGLVKNWIKHQPLDTIKNYFGVKVALYFSWLGFYTNMLILPSILGVIVFIVGLSTMFTNKYVDKICQANETVVLCPRCDTCNFTRLSDTCLYERINHILDNNVTVFFAICMAIWASIYLELWKRYSATIVHRWGSTDFSKQSEHARPAYLTRVKRKKHVKNKMNPVTRQPEPTLSFKFKLPSYMLSYTIIILYILLSVAVVMALIVYRMSTLSTNRFFGDSQDTQSYKYLLLLPMTTAAINLVVITILNFLYDYLAVFLTDLEYRRTQTEYDNSLSLKIYLFQFINYYSSLFYIAFFKGKWPGTPAKYNRIFGFRQEECSAGGCLMELFIQLSIIMVGKQAINALIEIGLPYIKKKYNQFRYGKQNSDEDGVAPISQWTRDYKLMEWDSMGLFQEYLEMVIQYGFCTLFVIAFPLGPLFALINNIFELRLDAKKFLAYYRRPVPKRQSSIGIWLGIMSVLGRLSVLTTAFIIAFSTNFIPRLYHDHSTFQNVDYVEFIYAYFNTSDFEIMSKPDNLSTTEFEFCRYPEFRNHPNSDEPYKRPPHYWKILTARLAFIIIFQNVAQWLQQFIDWIIPDKPDELDALIKRENYLVSNKIIREERNRVMHNAHNTNGNRSKLNDAEIVNGNAFYEAKS